MRRQITQISHLLLYLIFIDLHPRRRLAPHYSSSSGQTLNKTLSRETEGHSNALLVQLDTTWQDRWWRNSWNMLPWPPVSTCLPNIDLSSSETRAERGGEGVRLLSSRKIHHLSRGESHSSFLESCTTGLWSMSAIVRTVWEKDQRRNLKLITWQVCSIKHPHESPYTTQINSEFAAM